MLFKRLLLTLLTSSVLLVGISTSIYADPKESVSLKNATSTAIAAFGGEVLKAEAAEENDSPVYKIRLVNEGRVKEIIIDSQTGEIINP